MPEEYSLGHNVAQYMGLIAGITPKFQVIK